MLSHTYSNNNNKIINWEETFGGDGYVNGIDCDDGFMDVYLSPNSSRCMHQICMAFCMSDIS